MAETPASYFNIAALNIGDHVSRLTEEDHSEHDSVKSIREVYEENHFGFKLPKPNVVQRAFENINPKKSSGWDSTISPKHLKSVAMGTSISLTKLYNHCRANGRHRGKWVNGHLSLRGGGGEGERTDKM